MLKINLVFSILPGCKSPWCKRPGRRILKRGSFAKRFFKILTFAQRLLTEQIPHQACAKSSKEDLMQMPQNFNFADSGKLWGEKELARNQFLIWRMLHIVTQLY